MCGIHFACRCDAPVLDLCSEPERNGSQQLSGSVAEELLIRRGPDRQGLLEVCEVFDRKGLF